MAEERISQGITTEKELELNLSTESHKPWITAIGKALSSAVRIDILNLIKVHPLSLQEISRRLESRYLQQRCISAVWRMLIWYLQKASREFMAL